MPSTAIRPSSRVIRNGHDTRKGQPRHQARRCAVTIVPAFRALAVLLLAIPPAAEDAVTAAARSNFDEYLDFLAIPNVPDKPEDMRRNATFLERAFQKRRFSTTLLENPAGRPLVFAQF